MKSIYIVVVVLVPPKFARNTLFRYELVLYITTWDCQISLRYGYIALLVLHLLLLLNQRTMVAIWQVSICLKSISSQFDHLNWLEWFKFLVRMVSLLINLLGCMAFLHHSYVMLTLYMSTFSFFMYQALEYFSSRMFSFDLQSELL